jgi:hypothetical protein
MSLIRDDKPAEKKPKKLLSRGTKVVVESHVDRPGPNARTNSTFMTPNSADAITNPPKPYPANVRIDSYIRNQINALLNLGIADSARDLLATLVQERVDKLSDSEFKRYDDMLNILEAKDAVKQKK